MSNGVRDFNNLLYGLRQAADSDNEAQYEQKRAALQRMLKPFQHLARDPKCGIVAPEVLSWDDWGSYSRALGNGARQVGFLPPASATYSFCAVLQRDGSRQMLDAKGAADLYKAALWFADA